MPRNNDLGSALSALHPNGLATIDKVATCSRSSVWRVVDRAGTCHWIKASPHHGRPHFELEMTMLAIDLGWPAPTIVSTHADERFSYMSLSPAEGTRLREAPDSPPFRNAVAAAFGKLLSTLHRHRFPVCGYCLRDGHPCRTYADYQCYLAVCRHSHPVARASLREEDLELVDNVSDWAQQVVPRVVRNTLVHRDLAAGNVFVIPEDMAFVLIDFEFAMIGDPCADIAVIFQQWMRSPEERNAFLSAYTSEGDSAVSATLNETTSDPWFLKVYACAALNRLSASIQSNNSVLAQLALECLRECHEWLDRRA